MIAVLGARRVVIVLVLLLVNAALAGMVYMVMLPQQDTQERSLRMLRGQASILRDDIARMQMEFTQLEQQKAAFEKLEKDGFFKNQSRRQAEETFNVIQKKSGVNKAIASILGGVIEDSPEAAKAKYKILKSPIQIQLEAVDDVDVYHYLFLIEHYFPGHISVEGITLKREADVSGTVLRAIAAGENPALVSAQVDLLWRTMIPEAEVIGGDDAAKGGAQ
jgi:hypothetical protein